MAKVFFKGSMPNEDSKRLRQGDVVFCKAVNGAKDFWGVVDSELGVIALNGGSNKYVSGRDLYLHEKYSYWTITKRIPCEKVVITIEEIE